MLRPGGIFVNADYMPDHGLPAFSKRLLAGRTPAAMPRYAAGVVLSWPDWWSTSPPRRSSGRWWPRDRIYPSDQHSAEWLPPVSWHVAALRNAGFTQAGVLWRGGVDAAVIGVR